MTTEKQRRVNEAKKAAEDRQNKALASLAFCFSRSEVLRVHHDALIYEALAAGGLAAVNESTTLKARFTTYVCFWFAALAAVIERYQHLTANGTIPKNRAVDDLLTSDMIDVVKPFRNAIAHCSDHDDDRVLDLLGKPDSLPDWAGNLSVAFRQYFAPFGFTDHDASMPSTS